MILTERILTIDLSKDNLKSDFFYRNLEEIWEIIERSYSYVGGFKGAENIEDLLTKTKIWKIVKRDLNVSALVAYRDQWGLKSICAACDGSSRGKKDIYMLFCEDIKMQRSWSEVSHKAERINLKLGSIPISNQYVQEILNKPILRLDSDGYHYDRIIGGEVKTKVLVGWVKGYEFLPKILN